MKKIISISMFVISVGMVLFSEYYTKWPFDYHVANFIGYITLWSVALFILSLFAFVLENIKYKRWIYFTAAYFILSILIAYLIGDGRGGILNIDGELIIWFLIGLHSFVSIIYFIIQFVKSRNKSQTP